MHSLLTRSGEQQLHSKLSFRSRKKKITTTKRYATDRRSTKLNRLPQEKSSLACRVPQSKGSQVQPGDETKEGKKQNKDL